MKSKYIKRVVLEYGEDYQSIGFFKTLKDAKEYIRFNRIRGFTLTKEYSDLDCVETVDLGRACVGTI